MQLNEAVLSLLWSNPFDLCVSISAPGGLGILGSTRGIGFDGR